jgi:hypothetical protein
MPSGLVPMRMLSGDCMISAIATVAGRSYEEIAKTLGFELDASGIPTVWPYTAKDNCTTAGQRMCERLTQYGFHPAEGLLVAGMLLGMPKVDAVFIVDSDHPADNGSAHALARVNGQILDPRQPETPLSLEDVGQVHFAMVALPAQPVGGESGQ